MKYKEGWLRTQYGNFCHDVTEQIELSLIFDIALDISIVTDVQSIVYNFIELSEMIAILDH